MTRYRFGGGLMDFSKGRVTQCYSAETGGTQYTDLLDSDGNPVSSIPGPGDDALGRWAEAPVFYGPDEAVPVTELWASAGSGPRVRLVAQGRRPTPHLFDVALYGATGDGVTDDSAAILRAVELARVKRGTVFFPGGTFLTSQTIPIYSSVDYVGSGTGASRVKLADGANVDLFQTDGFALYTGGTSQNGPSHWSIRNLRLDGNGANQTGTSYALRVYGSCYRVEGVEIVGGKSGGVWSEWGTTGTDMEAFWSNFKVRNNFGPGLQWQGPHDSSFVNGQVFGQDGFNGIRVWGNAAGDQFTNVHVWGAHDVGWNIEQPVKAYNCVAEGATGVNVFVGASKTIWCGDVFGTNGTNPSEIGLQIGDATHSGINAYIVQSLGWNWGTGATPINFASDGGGLVDFVARKGTAAAVRSGSIHARSRVRIVCNDDASQGTEFAQPMSVFTGAVNAYRASDGTDRWRVNTSGVPASMDLPNGTRVTGFTDNYTTSTYRLDAADGSVQPGTPTGRGARIFSGSAAPTLSATSGDFYLRTGTPTTANQRLYVCTGGASWTGIL